MMWWKSAPCPTSASVLRSGPDCHERVCVCQIELRNNRLEQQAENNGALLAELAALLARLRVPPEFSSLLLGGPFEEPCMAQNMEAARWLTHARAALEPPALPTQYAGMHAVREKRAELERLRSTWVRRATDFLRTYLGALADPLLANRATFSQRGALKRPDHSELRYRCRAYAPLLHHLKVRRRPRPPLAPALCLRSRLAACPPERAMRPSSPRLPAWPPLFPCCGAACWA